MLRVHSLGIATLIALMAAQQRDNIRIADRILSLPRSSALQNTLADHQIVLSGDGGCQPHSPETAAAAGNGTFRQPAK